MYSDLNKQLQDEMKKLKDGDNAQIKKELNDFPFDDIAQIRVIKNHYPELYKSLLNKVPYLKIDELNKENVSKLDNYSKIKYIIEDAKEKRRFDRLDGSELRYELYDKYYLLNCFKDHHRDSKYYEYLLSDLNTTHDELMDEYRKDATNYVNKLMREYETFQPKAGAEKKIPLVLCN